MRHDRRRGGWVTTLLALAALVVVGFLCGAVAGFLWEDPGLVVAYLSGETEAVEWSDPGPVAAEPPPVESPAEPPAVAVAAPPAPAPASAEQRVARAEPKADPAPKAPEPSPAPKAPEPSPAPVPAKSSPKPEPVPAAAAPEGRFAVQVGAFGDSEAAEKLAERLRGRGYSTYVRASTESGESRWRVRVGPVPVRADAEALAAKLQRGEKLPTWVLDEGEG